MVWVVNVLFERGWKVVAPGQQLSKFELGKGSADMQPKRPCIHSIVSDYNLMHNTPETADMRKRSAHVIWR